MTKKERVIAALNHQETDFIPYQVDFTHEANEKMAAFYNNKDFYAGIGNHMISAYYDGDPRPIPGKEGYFKDDFGVIWNRNGADKDIGVVESLMIPEPSLDMYKFPAVPEAKIRKRCEDALANAGDLFTLGALGFSLFERAWTLTGMENLLEYMITEPDFVTQLLGAITDFNLQVVKIYLEYDFDCIFFGDDWGQQQGLIMGPVMWRKFIKPHLAKMYSLGREKGRFIGQHSCGDIQEIYPDLIDLGLSVHQTFQPEIYDIGEIKSLYGDRLSFWGGISTQRLLPFETPENLVVKVEEILRVIGKGGGYIAAPTHAIPSDVPGENIDALIKLLRNQGR